MDIKRKIVSHLKEYKRIILISRKPTSEELKNVLKIPGIGVGLIGIIGFLIQLLVQVIV